MDLKDLRVTRVQGELESLPDLEDAAWAAYRARLEGIEASFR